MSCQRMISLIIVLTATIISSFAQALAEPILIKLTLEKPSDYENAISLGVVAYHRFDDFVLAEFDKSKLGELDKVGLKYQIVDENPWSEEYFLVSSIESVTNIDLAGYGKILLEEPSCKLIKTSSEKANELREMRYSVIPIHRTAIPLQYKPTIALIKPTLEYSADLDSLINLVSQDSLYAWDLRLQNFKTRYSYSDSITKVRDWLFDKFASFGIDSLWLHSYFYYTQQWNVVATVLGTARPDRVIVVGGHYDSVVYGPGTDPLIWAPGADDNGTGTVAALEIARIIAKHPLPVTVMFVPFAQEEQGLIGSSHFAQYLFNQGTKVELMINSDMIGHSIDSDTAVKIYGSPMAKSYIDVMIGLANSYTYLRPYYAGQASNSDHYSFSQWGFDAVMAHEDDFFTNGYHNNFDVVDSINFPYMKEVVKMCLATLSQAGHSPSPVENLKALNGVDGQTIYLSWSANQPGDSVAYYNVRYGTSSGHYDSLHQVTALGDTIRNLTEDTTYYITVTAVNAGGFESIANQEVSQQVFPVTMDLGLLLVDETYVDGFYNMVNGDSVNAFYQRALKNYSYTYVNHSCPNCFPQNQLHLKELGRYSVVIIHSEDNRGYRSLGANDDSTYLVLKEYLNYGGKVIIEGRRNFSQGNDGEDISRIFHPGDIPFDYLKIKSAYVPLWTPSNRSEEFIGASSQVSGYPDLQVDSLRVTQCSNGLELLGRVPGVGYIDSLMAGEVIYRFHSVYDTSNSEGKSVAFRYLGGDYQFVYFDFPLYFIQEAQACSLLHQALSDLSMSPSIVENDEESKAPLSFSLKQNFPNPFNSETVMEYFLPKESQVKITIYNLLGQRVKIILDQRESAGHKRVMWDGKNEKGEMLSSGIYFYRIEAGEFAQTKKMVLLK